MIQLCAVVQYRDDNIAASLRYLSGREIVDVDSCSSLILPRILQRPLSGKQRVIRGCRSFVLADETRLAGGKRAIFIKLIRHFQRVSQRFVRTGKRVPKRQVFIVSE